MSFPPSDLSYLQSELLTLKGKGVQSFLFGRFHGDGVPSAQGNLAGKMLQFAPGNTVLKAAKNGLYSESSCLNYLNQRSELSPDFQRSDKNITCGPSAVRWLSQGHVPMSKQDL